MSEPDAREVAMEEALLQATRALEEAIRVRLAAEAAEPKEGQS